MGATAVGRWVYQAGANGTVTIPQGARLMMLTCTSADDTATVTIKGGDAIPVFSGQTFTLEIPPLGDEAYANSDTALQATSASYNVVFTNTRSFFASWLTQT